jgi:molecular chaperone DnaJ
VKDPCPYSVLGLARPATHAAVRAKYRQLVKLHHPDAGGDAARFQKIAAAYHTIGDVARKARYDRAHPITGPGGNTRELTLIEARELSAALAADYFARD